MFEFGGIKIENKPAITIRIIPLCACKNTGAYSCSLPLMPLFFQALLRLSNSFRSSVENSLLLSLVRSGCPAFTQAVYQNDAIA